MKSYAINSASYALRFVYTTYPVRRRTLAQEET